MRENNYNICEDTKFAKSLVMTKSERLKRLEKTLETLRRLQKDL